MSGDADAFYATALDLCRLLPDADGDTAKQLERGLEQVRFGGAAPPSDERDRILRLLEKAAAPFLKKAQEHEEDYRKYIKQA